MSSVSICWISLPLTFSSDASGPGPLDWSEITRRLVISSAMRSISTCATLSRKRLSSISAAPPGHSPSASHHSGTYTTASAAAVAISGARFMAEYGRWLDAQGLGASVAATCARHGVPLFEHVRERFDFDIESVALG